MGRARRAQYNRMTETAPELAGTRSLELMTRIRTRSVFAGCLLLCAVAVLTACASSSGTKTPKKMQVRTHVDPEAQFSTYRTYGFVPMPGTNIEGKTTALTIHFMRA